MPDEGKSLPDIGAILIGGPKAATEPSEKEQGREDQLQAFTDFSNDELSKTERLDALAFLVELIHDSGPTVLDDED